MSHGLTADQLVRLQETMVNINRYRDSISRKMNSPVALAEDMGPLAVLVDDLSDLTFIVEGYAENYKADLYTKLKRTEITSRGKTQLMGVSMIQEEIKRDKTAIDNDLLVDKLKAKIKNMTTLMTICQSILRVKAGQSDGKY